MFTKDDFEYAYNGKKVLVIGNTGFKGSWLSLWLYILGANVTGYALEPVSDIEHFSVLKLDKKIKYIRGDIRDRTHLQEVVETVQPEYVFHLAAQAIVGISYDNPKLTFDTNVGGSVNVLDVVKECDCVKSLVYITSDKCYKNKEWIWGYRETDELGGIDPYSASKACAELVFNSYKHCFFDNRDIGISSARAGNVIGGGDWADKRIVPDCIRALMDEKTITIRNPNATRPWQHVLEPLSGYLTIGALQYNDPKKYSSSWNLGPKSSSVHTVKELTEEVIKNWNYGNLEILSENKFYESTLLKLDCDRARMELNWKPRWNFKNTIEETVYWYKEFTDNHIVSEEQIERYMKDI